VFLVILVGIIMVRIKAVHRGWVDVLNKYAFMDRITFSYICCPGPARFPIQ
jgi:hypothetical protein